MKPGISIIILTLNGAHHMARLLDSFFITNTHSPVELIIIDHGSQDNTAAVVAKYRTKAFIRMIALDKNHSFASSCNRGAGKARHPYLLFLNNDIVYTSDVLPTALSKLEDPAIGAVGVRLEDDPTTLPTGKEPGVQHTGIAFEWDEKKGFHRPKQIRHNTIADARNVISGYYPAVTGAFLLCRKADFEKVGGFCEEYDYGFEDIDFCLQIGVSLNKKCWCINDLSLQHEESAARKLAPDAVKKDRRQKNDIVFKRRMQAQVEQVLSHSSPPSITSGLSTQALSPNAQTRTATLNVLFVLYQSIDSNGGLHVQLHADRLKALGANCLMAVPTNATQNNAGQNPDPRVRTFAQVENKGLVFADGRGPDIVHAWTPREIVRRFCDKLLAKNPCPLIIHLEDNEELLTEVAVGRPFSELQKLSVEELDKIVPNGRYHPIHGRRFLDSAQGMTMIIDTLARFNSHKVPSLVLPPPVDERLFYPRPLNLALRKELGIPDRHVVLAYTGNVHAANRTEVRELYRAVHLLNQQQYPAVLIRTGINAVPLGDEPWITAYEKNLGWVERNRVPDILAAADVLVQPGVPGPFNDQRIPSKLPEFFAMGRPVILPRTNLGQKVEHCKEGYLLNRADAKEISQAIKIILKDARLKTDLAKGALEFSVKSNTSFHSNLLNTFYCHYSGLCNSIVDSTSLSKFPTRWHSLVNKLDKRESLLVVFVNDNNFAHGAGIALMRQVDAFLSKGHRVLCIAWKDFGHNKQPNNHNFIGVHFVEHLDGRGNLHCNEIDDQLFNLITSKNPDLIVTGNFHNAGWPISLLKNLNNRGFPVVVYAHDLYWATGGCAHPLWQDCKLTLERCSDVECPKPMTTYPQHKYRDITTQSKAKIEAFSGINPIALAANSTWTEKEFRRLYGDNTILIDTIPLPINTDQFKPPLNRDEVRERLGLDKSKFIILAGSCALTSPGKGGSFLVEIATKFLQHDNVQFVIFGNGLKLNSIPKNIHPLGYVSNVEDLVNYYQSSDVFLNPVTIEAFGQTMLESLACGTPVICFPVCGVTDVSIDGETALCTQLGDITAIEQAIFKLIRDPLLKAKLGENGRNLALSKFSMKKNFIYWQDYLRKIDLIKRRNEIFEIRKFSWVDYDKSQDIKLKNIGGIGAKGVVKKTINTLPMITVAIVLYNSVKAIEYTILSILNQNYLNIELIVIDGESTDGSLDIIKYYNNYIDFWFSAKDKGVYDAMNYALDVATGDYIIFMGAGDTFIGDDALSRIMKPLYSSYDVLHGHVYWQSVAGDDLLLKSTEFAEKFEKMVRGDFSEQWLRGLPPHQATLIKTELAKKLRFDLSYTVSADWDMFFRAYACGATFHLVDEVISNYPGGGYSSKKSSQWILDVLGIVLRYTKDTTSAEKYFMPIYEHHKKFST